MNVNLTEEEYRFCVRVAKLYYENDLTQNEIAEKLGFSRVKINRVLKQVREAGILEVHINAPDDFYFDIENALIAKYGLRDAFVVMDEEPGPALYLSLARGAASWLKQHFEPGICIGLGLGRTISFLPQAFNLPDPVDCTFVEIVGAASSNSNGLASYNVTSKMAELAGGKAEFFYAPTFVSDPDLKRRLLQESSVVKAVELARSATITLQSVGPVDNSALLFLYKYIDESVLEELQQKGAVGDALGHYYDRNGNHIPSTTDDRCIGIELDDLKRIPWSVCIAGGSEKVLPIHGAIKGNFFNVLVTNLSTAQSLLNIEANHAG